MLIYALYKVPYRLPRDYIVMHVMGRDTQQYTIYLPRATAAHEHTHTPKYSSTWEATATTVLGQEQHLVLGQQSIVQHAVRYYIYGTQVTHHGTYDVPNNF